MLSLIDARNKKTAKIQQEALKRYEKSAKIRARNLAKLKSGTPLDVDTKKRVKARQDLIDPHDGLTLERLIGASDLFPLSYLEAGVRAGKPVCRIEVKDSVGRVLAYGTGFLVSPTILLTNHHVLENEDTARWSLAQFNYETDVNLLPLPIRSFRLCPEQFFVTDEGLDFTLVAVEKQAGDGCQLQDFGYLTFNPEPGKILIGEYASCIQHPEGAPKSVAIRENQLVTLLEDFVHYTTDTKEGSSGSPVFNDDWKVVALHHAGVPDKNNPGKFVANEGVRISSIARKLSEIAKTLSPDKLQLISELYQDVPRSTPEHPPGSEMEVDRLPAEVYENAQGYDPAFLGPGYEVPLPNVTGKTSDDVLVTKDRKTVLDYVHFSIVMSKSRKLALFTAVNIDGPNHKDIKRGKDVWYYDPRIDRNDQCGPELYKANDLDYGHLVRRLDPDSGTDAEDADKATFHFTNCSPQHKDLNRVTWEGLENYILSNAVQYGLRVSVFTGCVFRSDDIVYREKYKIPAEFWKVVVIVRDDGKLSATAYLLSQKNLIDNLEFAFGTYKTYQVPVATIEDLTSLDFGNIRTFDPLAKTGNVSGILIENEENIRL